MGKKIWVVVAHDDDSILGVGGRILRHLTDGDRVHVTVCHDGRTSHRAVFGQEKHPSMTEVGKARLHELSEAMKIMGATKRLTYEVLNLPGEEGRPSQNQEKLQQELEDIVEQQQPDIFYYHAADAHVDHRAVNKVMTDLFENFWISLTKKAFQFMIWNRQLAELQGQSNIDPLQAPEIPGNAIIYQLSEKEFEMKRQALHCMKSQVQVWPYPDWDPQPHAVLNKDFINYFLRGEEILIPVK